MMSTYEEKLFEFAEGKQLIRLARPVRDRADGVCDACGSTKPRNLYALKEQVTDRYFFLGDNCLKEMVKRRTVQRRFSRESGPAIYDLEMERRRLDETSVPIVGDVQPENSHRVEQIPNMGEPKHLEAQHQWQSNLSPRLSLFKSSRDYHAFVVGVSKNGATCCLGYAREAIYVQVLRKFGRRVVSFEWVDEERADAIHQAISKAMEAASRLMQNPEGIMAAQTESIEKPWDGLASERSSESASLEVGPADFVAYFDAVANAPAEYSDDNRYDD